ncbi:MAG: hypothetical protein HY039_03605 [Nitrospirae bacterium]|nr:hypothetical protein [Nitrospirota bacterium]
MIWRGAFLLGGTVLWLAVSWPAEAAYVFHLRNGHRMVVDSYVDEGTRFRTTVTGGTVWVEKNDVTAIMEEEAPPGSKTKTSSKAKGTKKGKPDKPAERWTAPTDASAPAVPAGGAGQVLAGPRDNEGKTEQWWRERVANFRKKVDEFNREQQFINAEIDRIEKGSAAGAFPEEARDRLGYYRIRRGEIGRNIEDLTHIVNVVLPEEARRAGAPPGWLRE